MNKKQSSIKSGISLIVLVITIIVMIILAGAIILTLNNNGIINQASNAVEATNLAQAQYLASMGWAEAYANGERTEAELKEEVKAIFEKNNLNYEDYGFIITEKGVQVTQERWIQTADYKVVKKGAKEEITLAIGDTVEYSDKANADGTEKYTSIWSVLGAEDGKLLLVSLNSVVEGGYTLGSETDLAKAQDDFVNGPKYLDAVCAPFGTGKGAVKARCIRVEDVNRITGYDPNKGAYNKDVIGEYNQTVTYSWDVDSNPYYVSTNGASGNLTKVHNTFMWYDGANWNSVTKATNNPAATGATDSARVDIASTAAKAQIKSTFYSYTSEPMKSGSAIQKAILILKYNTSEYWLANQQVCITGEKIRYGLLRANGRTVDGYEATGVGRSSFVYSDGTGGVETMSVKAVVELSPDVTLKDIGETKFTTLGITVDKWEIQ